jgi:hypothetical protein
MVVLIPGEEYYSLHITTLIPNNIDGGNPYWLISLPTIYPEYYIPTSDIITPVVPLYYSSKAGPSLP